MEQRQNPHAFIRPSPSRQYISPSEHSFRAGDNSRPPRISDLRLEGQQPSPASPLHSPTIPVAALEHVRALRSCDPLHIVIGLSLTRERKVEHLQALQDYPTADVLRWHNSLRCFYDYPEGSKYQPQYRNPPTRPPSAQRFSNASTCSSSSDARSSFLSTSTASTQWSAASGPSPIQRNPNHIYPLMSNQHNHQGPLAPLAPQPALQAPASVPTMAHPPPPPPPPPSIALPMLRQHTYYCTTCDKEPYKKKDSWLAHETDHQRRAQWHCKLCGLVLYTERHFRAHHNRSHRCKPCRHADDAINVLEAKLRWGCGFCVKSLDDLTERNNHIASHYEKDKVVKADWNHTTVVKGLLEEPTVAGLWAALMEEEGHGSQPENWPEFSWNKDESSEVVTNLEHQRYEKNLQMPVRKLYDLRKPTSTVVNKGRGPKNNAHTTTQPPQALPPLSPPKARNLESLTSRPQRPTAMVLNQEAGVYSALRDPSSGFPRPDSEIFPAASQLNLHFPSQGFAPSSLRSSTQTSAGDSGRSVSHNRRGNTTTNQPRLPPRTDSILKANFDNAQSSHQAETYAFPGTINPQHLMLNKQGRYTRSPQFPTASQPRAELHYTARHPVDISMAAPHTDPNLEMAATDQDFNSLMQETSSYDDAYAIVDSPAPSLQNTGQPSSKFGSHRISFMDVDSDFDCETG